MILDLVTVLESLPLLICAGFVYDHCSRSWAELDNTHGKDLMCAGFVYDHYTGRYYRRC